MDDASFVGPLLPVVAVPSAAVVPPPSKGVEDVAVVPGSTQGWRHEAEPVSHVWRAFHSLMQSCELVQSVEYETPLHPQYWRPGAEETKYMNKGGIWLAIRANETHAHGTTQHGIIRCVHVFSFEGVVFVPSPFSAPTCRVTPASWTLPRSQFLSKKSATVVLNPNDLMVPYTSACKYST